MHSFTGNLSAYKASREGGLSHTEAVYLTGLDDSSLDSGDYEPEDITALGSYILEDDTRGEMPADDLEGLINQLLDDPGSIIAEWDTGGYPFENNDVTVQEKRDEYLIRTLYAFNDDISQDLLDEALYETVSRKDYRHDTAETLSKGHLGLVIGQYIGQIQELAENQRIVDEAFSTVAETDESSAVAAANIDIDRLPNQVLENVYIGSDELESDLVTTRLRNMVGAGRCEDLEEQHEEVLLGDEPTKNNTLITLDDELVGSLKHEGETSLMGLQDLQFDGRQVLQKGMCYRVSHPMLGEMTSERFERKKPTHREWEQIFQPGRMKEEQTEYENWEIEEVERLELRPLRFAGEKGDKTKQEFRQQIETKRTELEELSGTL